MFTPTPFYDPWSADNQNENKMMYSGRAKHGLLIADIHVE